MKAPLVGLVCVLLVLSLPAAARADIPPSPPPGLKETPKDAPKVKPLPVALAGIALALASGLVGVACLRRHPAAGMAGLVLAAGALIAGGGVAWWADRAWDEHADQQARRAALQARYDQALANWRPLGPVPRPPRETRGAETAMVVFAWTPQTSLPHLLPLAALAAHGPVVPQRLRPGDVPPEAKPAPAP